MRRWGALLRRRALQVDIFYLIPPRLPHLPPCLSPGTLQPPEEHEDGRRVRRRDMGTMPRSFLMAFDLSPIRAEEDLSDAAVIRKAVPRETLNVLERLRQIIDTIRPANAPDGLGALQPHPVSMHIEHTPEEFCGVCGVDSMEGGGSGACEYQQACDDSFVSAMSTTAVQLSQGPSTRRAAAEATRLTSSVQQLLQSPDTSEARFTILASLDVITTAANSTPFDVATLKDALSHSLGLSVDDPYQAISGEEAVQVEVVRSAVDEMFAHMFADELRHEGGRRFLEEGGGGGGGEPILMESQRHRVILVTASQGRKEGILQALGVDDPMQQASRRLWDSSGDHGFGTGGEREASPGNASVLAADIASYMHEHGGEAQSSVERVEVNFERMLSIPGSNAALLSGSGAFAPEFGDMSVLVTDTTASLEPLSSVVYGRTYRLVIQHFPPRSLISVAALRATVSGEEEDESDRVLATIMTDEKGAAVVPNLNFVSARLFPPGDYEIQALVLRTQAFGLSPLFTLSHKGPERKLFRHRF